MTSFASGYQKGGIPMPKAVIYARYSSNSQREESIEDQLRECREFAVKNDLTVIASYCDYAQTGTNDKREQFQKMLKDSDAKRFQAVITYKIDRFARNRYDSALHKTRLKKNGVKMYYAKDNIPDTPEGNMLEGILESFAEYFSQNLSVNTKRGMIGNALKAKFNGSHVPFGYKVVESNYVLDELTAPIVAKVFSDFNQGMKQSEIIQGLNVLGYKTSTGKLFTPNAIYRMLRYEKYTGVYKFMDVKIEGGMPAIISKEVFEQANKKLVQYRHAPAAKPNKFLLSTKIFCGHCGNTMFGDSGKKQYFYYTCTKKRKTHDCTKKSVVRDWLEDLVINITINSIFRTDVMNRIANSIVLLQDKEARNNETLKALVAKHTETENYINNLMNAIMQGVVTKSTKEKLVELENFKLELELAIEKAEIEVPKLTKQHIIYYLSRLKEGDITNQAYREKIIDMFVNKVYVLDDNIKIIYNTTDEENSELTLTDITNMDASEKFEFDCKWDTNLFTSKQIYRKSKEHTAFIIGHMFFFLKLWL